MFGSKRHRAALLHVLRNSGHAIKGLELMKLAGVPRWRFYSLMNDLEAEGLVTHTVGVPEARRGGLPAFYYSAVD